MFTIETTSEDDTDDDDRRCIVGKYQLLLTDRKEIKTWRGKVVYTKEEKTCTKKGDMFFDCSNNKWVFGSLDTGVQDDFMIIEENPPVDGESECPADVQEWKINLDGRFRPSFKLDEEIEVVCEGGSTLADTTTTTTTSFPTTTLTTAKDFNENAVLDLVKKMQEFLGSKIDDLSNTQKITQEQIFDMSIKNNNLTEKLEQIEKKIKNGFQAQPVVYENISSNFLDTLAAPDEDSSELNRKPKTFVIGDTVDVVPKESYGFIKLNGSNYRKLFPQDGGTIVRVNIDVLGITKIDSKSKLVGLEMVLTNNWEDNRIIFPLGAPQVNESFQFDPAVLK